MAARAGDPWIFSEASVLAQCVNRNFPHDHVLRMREASFLLQSFRWNALEEYHSLDRARRIALEKREPSSCFYGFSINDKSESAARCCNPMQGIEGQRRIGSFEAGEGDSCSGLQAEAGDDSNGCRRDCEHVREVRRNREGSEAV